MKLLRKITLAASLAAAGLAVPAAGQVGARGEKRGGENEEAQEGGQRGGVQSAGDKKQAETKKEAPAGGEQRANSEGQAGQTEGRAQAERGAGAAANQPAVTPSRKLSREEGVEFLGKLQAEENLHRQHIARLSRIRELAQDSKDQGRAKDVEELLAKENARYERVLANLERHVGTDNFRKGQQKLADSVRQKRAQGAAGKGEEKDNKEREKDKDKDKDKPKEREGDKPKENAERKGDANSGGEGKQRGGGR